MIAQTRKKPVKYPVKTTLNMVMSEKSKSKPLTLIIGLVIIAVLVVLAVKFAALDQLARLSRAEEEYVELNSQNQKLVKELEDYDDVLREYRLYSTDWTEGAGFSKGIDRALVLDLVEDQLMSRGNVSSIVISGDVLNVQMADMNLEQISAMLDQVKASPVVYDAELNTASSEKNGSTYSVFTITVYLQEVEK